jgi:hypothetical protein
MVENFFLNILEKFFFTFKRTHLGMKINVPGICGEMLSPIMHKNAFEATQICNS